MYYENWLKGKDFKTQADYLRCFIEFLEWLDTDTEGLYELYLGMISVIDPRTRKRMGILVVDYQKHLMETRGITGGSSRLAYKAVKGFFKANELPFEVTGEKIEYDSVETPNISLEQQRKVLSVTGSYKMKAYIKVGRDSGLRTGDIAHLPIGKVREVLDDPSIEYYTFEWKTSKTGKMANPVLGPDCLEAIREWMNYRVNTLGISAEDGDPLFCLERKRNGYTDKWGREVPETVRGDWMKDGNMGGSFRMLVMKADLKPLPGNKRLPCIHSFRVFQKTALEYAGVPTSWVNKMQGRAGEGTGGTYTKPNPEELIEMFKKGYAALSGIEESQHEKIEKLTHELGLSQYEMSELRDEREELRVERDSYRAEYDLRSRLQSIIDKARLDGLPEEIIKKLEENLENVETFEEGVVEFNKLKEEIELDWDYEIVDEEVEMINYMADGWEFVQKRNDGRYVLKKHFSGVR